ncbi:hypothetical protein OGH69_12730 [Flavobacterium sp. MFBS3-15]|uniref:hypothetical protein n=1 Tax=Flavobacterium sp. MFBS3-15 TaxID=2989816 RepID=UPI0022361842|nr:hypothetical protein [Flavobacterium sp. MFBS3-15]MCW4469837.1 hypothetical protein [Flavobacterium sp. MFBS3-15]
MRKILFVLIINIFTTFSYGQTIEQKAKVFLDKFNKMNNTEKRIASNLLVSELNAMDPETKGRWLSALGFGKENKENVKKIYPKPWTIEEVEKEVLKKVHFELIEGSFMEMGYDKSNLNILELKIIKKISNKDLAASYNNNLQKEIDSIEQLISDEKAERTKIKEKIPEGYAERYWPDDEWDENGKKIKDTLKPHYKRFLYLTDNIKTNIRKLPEMKDSFAKGIINEIDWEDETISHFLVEAILQEKDELDDAKIHVMIIADYKPYDFSKNDFEQFIYARLVEYEKAEDQFYSPY